MAITMFVSLYTTRFILNGLEIVYFFIHNIVGDAIAMLVSYGAVLKNSKLQRKISKKCNLVYFTTRRLQNQEDREQLVAMYRGAG